jgi:predicted nucleic acid-binding protein
MSLDFVVDASVGIKLFLVEPLADRVRLPLQVAWTAGLAEDALALALEHGATTYDAASVALAQKLSLPLFTADEALVRRPGGTGLDVRWLGEWPG